MPERTFSSPEYRYGFNGKEKDEEGEWGSLTHYDYGFRIYNPGVGRFLSVDPLTRQYSMLTPYQFASNTPIAGIDLDGLELVPVITEQNEYGYDVTLTPVPELSQDYYGYGSGQGGLSGYNQPTLVVNPNEIFYDLDEALHRGKQLYAAKQEILIQRRKAEIALAQHKARSSNIFATGYDVSPLPTLVESGRQVKEENYALAGGLFLFALIDFVDKPVSALFRGTSAGFRGSSTTRALGITSTSNDPVVATIFALESKKYGKGVVHIANANDLKGVTSAGQNARGALEAEVGLNLLPEDFAARASSTITADQARGILKEMGVDLPSNITGSSHGTEVLQNSPRLNQQQINEFITRAKELLNDGN